MKTWSKTHVDPTKRGNPNGGESENTRLNHQKAEKSGIHGTRARAINIIIYKCLEGESGEERERVRKVEREKGERMETRKYRQMRKNRQMREADAGK